VARRGTGDQGAAREAIDPGWISRFLRVITDPNVAFILMLVGIYGLIFELSSPGAVAPGVIGTICLLLGLYALNMLPINYAGLGLILLGSRFWSSKSSTRPWFWPRRDRRIRPRSVMLFELEAPGFRLSWPVIGVTAAIFIGLILVVLGSLRRAQRGPIRLGASHARPVRRNPRLVRERRPRLHPR
jgi:Membrane-bound serine protease (ClpP class)